MTEFNAALNMATAHVYLIEWMPEDWPLDMAKRKEWCPTYVVAMSVDEATNRLSSNPADIKRITVLGDVVERDPFAQLAFDGGKPLADGEWLKFGSYILNTDKPE